ncbi:PREDICTED: lactosylceramide 1,3-N-acetyl-beta-D-glucosaminyltransferase-like [Rhagoletis zephyria]|uniref:lactosylceramide 1,3-N-acetyl-beta-D-glucosaminyltransferase-like n=1 Tax=Rhagoletis zephyria TaxID=28612 RepID=UPI00081120D4|nr:PREDICTED: lactosylceramide 1,3-N-acetyl-beta-D-glucosaminyltransferase-like [Rhagoletis zephyria]
MDNASLESRLYEEARQFNDIIQFPFTDSYYNLTLKSLAVLRWTSLHCSRAKFILKLDNDCYVRVKPFIDQLKALSTDALYGLNRRNDPVLRSGKWAIDQWYYPYTVYPAFHPSAYLVPGTLALPLYEALLSSPQTDIIPALPFEDVYVTGILAERLRLPRAIFPGMGVLFDRRYSFLNLIQFGSNDREDVRLLRTLTIAAETIGDDDLRRIWRQIGAD